MAAAFGKTILFGEHAVVYGVPAIASAIGLKTEVKVTGTGKELKIRAGKESNIEALKEITLAIMDKMELKENVELEEKTELIVGAGMGSSASYCVATVRALAEYFGKKMGEKEVNNYAYEGEKISHGNPSGIDNTVAAYGGIVWFRRNLGGGKNTVERLKIRQPVEVVLGHCGKTGNTKKIVQKVKEKKEKEPERLGKLLREIEGIVFEAKKALEGFELKKTGKLMTKNQEKLRELGVSTNALEKMCDTALSRGALGAKLTGAGGGGCIIALTPGKILQENVAQGITDLGFKAIKTRIGV